MMQNSESSAGNAYESMTDEAVVERVQAGDRQAEEYLYHKYKGLVRYCARSYFLIGADYDDIMQEGMIGLHKAIRDFRPQRQATFHSFAELCIKRQIITAIKTATRQKHMPLNTYVSLNKPLYEDESERTLIDVISGARTMNPEELFISREQMQEMERELSKVASEFEWEVLTSYLQGMNYVEIAHDLGRSVKSVDNALQRIKKKLEKYLKERYGEEPKNTEK